MQLTPPLPVPFLRIETSHVPLATGLSNSWPFLRLFYQYGTVGVHNGSVGEGRRRGRKRDKEGKEAGNAEGKR